MITLTTVTENRNLWNRRKKENTGKEKYLEAKRKSWEAFIRSKVNQRENDLKMLVQRRSKMSRCQPRDDQNCGVFTIAKRMIKANQYIIGQQFLMIYNGVLIVKDEDKKITGKKLFDRVGME